MGVFSANSGSQHVHSRSESAAVGFSVNDMSVDMSQSQEIGSSLGFINYGNPEADSRERANGSIQDWVYSQYMDSNAQESGSAVVTTQETSLPFPFQPMFYPISLDVPMSYSPSFNTPDFLHHQRSYTMDSTSTLIDSPLNTRALSPLIDTKENISPLRNFHDEFAESFEGVPEHRRQGKTSLDDQALDVLHYMKRKFPHLTLPRLLTRVFSSEDDTLVRYWGRFCNVEDFVLQFLEGVHSHGKGSVAMESFLS
ncbi:hypothetical protein PM082_006320 [Marasmius tenuissimus]|nr:hypothetical protein PM082_006320 [Marasmius tenuissimus]